MNYFELTFTYTSSIETTIINDVLAAELGEIGFESFTENENGLLGYISESLYNEETCINTPLLRFIVTPKKIIRYL